MAATLAYFDPQAAFQVQAARSHKTVQKWRNCGSYVVDGLYKRLYGDVSPCGGVWDALREPRETFKGLFSGVPLDAPAVFADRCAQPAMIIFHMLYSGVTK